jgi:hypothetical protein
MTSRPRTTTHTYILGDSASILHAEFNDPREQELDTDDVNNFPAYLRFEGEDREASYAFCQSLLFPCGILFMTW